MTEVQEIASFTVVSDGPSTGGSFGRALILNPGRYCLKAVSVTLTGSAYITVGISEKMYGLDLYALDKVVGPITADGEWDFECYTEARLSIYAQVPDSMPSVGSFQLWLLKHS
jgi:hypothetical protein